MRKIFFLPFILVLVFGCQQESEIKISQLRTEYLINPLAIDQDSPRFSWAISSPDSGFMQTSYQLRLEKTSGNPKAKNGSKLGRGC